MNIPTKNFFYGMEIGEEIIVELDRGKNILVSLMLKGEPDEAGNVSIYFKVNGQLRNVIIKDKSVKVDKVENGKADPSIAGLVVQCFGEEEPRSEKESAPVCY